MSRELSRIATGRALVTVLMALAGVALHAPEANATVRVFVTPSTAGYGLTIPSNAFQPTFSTVYPNGEDYNAYDYYSGAFVCTSFPPVNAPSGTCANPVSLDSSAYVWLQFQNEPNNRRVDGLHIEIRECGQSTPAPVTTCFYVQNDTWGMGYKRWTGPATPPDYAEWHNNPQLMLAWLYDATGIKNSPGDAPWNMYKGATRTCLVGAVAGDPGKTYEILITYIHYDGYPAPSVSGGAFSFVGTFGACCYGYMPCLVTTWDDCTATGGSYMGNGTECNSCVGACCSYMGGCIVTDPLDCWYLFMGVFMGYGSDCDPDPCPPVAACCWPDGWCSVTNEVACPGIWHPEWPDCGVAQCLPPTGACCFEHEDCEQLTQAACTTAGGLAWFVDLSCVPNPCAQPIGACCYPDGTCAPTASGDCTGIWHAEWADCTVAQCPQPTAACCYPDGSCAVTEELACTGVWHPEWADCIVAQCPQPPAGACCFAGSDCEVLTASECAALEGDYKGQGTTCDPNPCVCHGDLNCDGVVNFGDINPFVLILSNPAVWQQTYPGCPALNGDVDGNGSAGFEDINPFVALIVQSPIECQY